MFHPDSDSQAPSTVDERASPEKTIPNVNELRLKAAKSVPQLTSEIGHSENKSEQKMVSSVGENQGQSNKDAAVLLRASSAIDLEIGQTRLVKSVTMPMRPVSNVTFDTTWLVDEPVSTGEANEPDELPLKSSNDPPTAQKNEGSNTKVPTNGDFQPAGAQLETVEQKVGIPDQVRDIEVKADRSSSEKNGGKEVHMEEAIVSIEGNLTEKPILSEELDGELDYDMCIVSDESPQFEIKSSSPLTEQRESDQVQNLEGSHYLEVATELEPEKGKGLTNDEALHIEVSTRSSINDHVGIEKTKPWEDDEKEKITYKNQKAPLNMVDEYKTCDVSIRKLDESKPGLNIGDEKENFLLDDVSKLSNNNPMNKVKEDECGSQNDSGASPRSWISTVATSVVMGGSLLFFIVSLKQK